MKSLLFLTLIVSSTAFASITGEYQLKKNIPVMFAGSIESCGENGGTWVAEGEDGHCMVEASDTVYITKKEGKLNLHVTTIGSNLHMCEFEGEARKNLLGNVVSKVEAEDYDIETDSLKKVICVVKAKFSKGGKVLRIEANDNCRSFCGANAWLETEGLEKVK